MKRWLKRIAVVFGIFIVMVGLLLGLTQTSFFRNWLKNRIVAQGARYLNGQLSIASIEGNLFTDLQMTGILVTARDDTVLFVPRLRVDLSPSRLLHMELRIDSMTIDSPYGKLVQAADSSWNFANLVRTDTLPPQDTAKETDASAFRILLNDFILRDGSLSLTALDTTLPPAIRKIGVRFAMQYSDTAQQLALKGLSFNLEKPPFRLEQLSLDASRRSNKITLGNLVIRTARNQLDGQGIYVASDSAVSSGQLASEPFDFSELTALVPALGLYGSPLFEIEARLERDSLVAKLGIIEPPQRIDLGFDVANVSKTMNVATHDLVRYYLNIGLTNFSLAHWLGDTAMDYRANGTIALAGKGFTAEDADITLNVNLADVSAMGRSIDRIAGDARYAAGNLDGHLDASGDFGGLNSVFSVLDILKSQNFNVSLTTSHLNLAPLLQMDSLTSDINLSALVQGSGFDKQRLTGNARFDVSSSTISGVRVDTVFARADFTGDSYRLDTLEAASTLGRLSLAGQGVYDGNHDLSFTTRLKSLSPLKEMLSGVDTLSGNGVLSGTVSGTLDSLSMAGDLELHRLRYNTFDVEFISGRCTALSQGDSLSGDAQLSARQLGTEGFGADSVVASSHFTAAEAAVVVDGFHRPGIEAHVESVIAFDSLMIATFPNITLDFRQQHWRGGSPETRVTVDGDDYRIENLTLRSPLNAGGEEQSVFLAGLFSMTGSEDFTLMIDRLDFERLISAFDMPDKIAGRLTAETHLSGTASAPILTGRLTIDSGLVNQFPYRAIHFGFDYKAEKLAWSSSLLPYQADSLAITGFVPLNLSFTNTGDLVYRDRPFEITVTTSGLPLSVIQASGQPFKQVQGFITADMHIANTIDAPSASGSFGLRDGTVSMPRYGIEYSDILAKLSIHDAVLTLDTLQAMRDKGMLTGSGSLQFEKDLLAGVIKTTQFDFLANSFYLIRHKDYQVDISGDAHLTGNSLEPTFAGNITILRSSFFLPALMEEAAAAQAAADKSMPLLVKATPPPDTLADSTDTALAIRRSEIDTTEVDWYKNLRGQFKVTIPRNTWLRSPDMNLEIGEGDLDLVKNGPDFEIFGPLRIMRGQYNLYGKRFTILQGSLLFQGGVEYNPEVSMQAQYVFRTADREKKTLKLDVSGKAFSPVLQFMLDDNVIEEKDAIAYVMYGRSMEELTSGQQSGAGAAQADLAKGAAANMLSNQLSQTLGSKLGLDVVDISSQGSLASATMTVGKYLTNNLFMSYQRSVGQTQGQEATPEIVTLEYELNKYLFLQLLQGDEKTSGVDFIFKYQH
jgi:translocation and assembly module TamB